MFPAARNPRRMALVFGLSLAWTMLSASFAAAQAPELYALNSSGLLTVNATKIDDLSGSGWVGLAVDGADRYAIKTDGTVDKNGLELYKLKFTDINNNKVDVGDWVGITFVDGSLWALSEFGYIAQDGVVGSQFSPSAFLFTAIFSGPTGTWSLRADGAVFANTTFNSTFAFDAGTGLNGATEGTTPDTTWESGTVGPDGKVYAVRRDGKVVRGDVLGGMSPFPGTVVAALPFGTVPSDAMLYADIAFTEAGSRIVLRGNGELYDESNNLTPLIEFKSTSPVYVDLLPLPADMEFGTTDMSFFALRSDGKLYRETSQDALFDLDKSKYCCLALSLTPPNLDNIDNASPVVTKYTLQAISGTEIAFPILATDTDLDSAELVVTVDETTLPVGASFDEIARTVTWPDPVKGSAKIKVSVNDGVNKPVNVTYSVKVSDPDTNPDKNKSPKVSKIKSKSVQGLVGFELALPILAVDPDGDTLTITVDDTQEPFTLGATFDELTNTFLWTDPTLQDIGTYKIQFNVSDGIKTVKLSVTIEIVSSLLSI